jgi:hypothetical protein
MDPAYAVRILDALRPDGPAVRAHDGVSVLTGLDAALMWNGEPVGRHARSRSPLRPVGCLLATCRPLSTACRPLSSPT